MFSTTLLAVIICSLKVDKTRGLDEKLRIYSFPVGQGDAQLIECPDGQLTVVDLGTRDGANQGFWHITELRGYFSGKYGKIRNIVITHNHQDHYSLIASVLRGSDGMNSLQNIYISKTDEELPSILQNWINEIGGASKIRTFNNGNQCGANNVSCGVLDLCPYTPIVAKVLSVNAGKACTQGGDHENVNSIVFSINYKSVKVQMNGDFEDCSSNDLNGAQGQLVAYYGRELEATVYKLAHHGASNLANKKVMRDAVKPKAIFVSGNPDSSYHHPRCEIIDAFIKEVGTLCEPGNPKSSNYCGLNSFAGPSDSILQEKYTCADDRGCKQMVQDNRLAIYTTVPGGTSLNTIEFVTDGTHWGFINNFVPRNSRRKRSESEPADCNVTSMKVINGSSPPWSPVTSMRVINGSSPPWSPVIPCFLLAMSTLIALRV